ncbi:PDZ domain-containing protein [Alkalicoccus daliensis]|uniref:PDZ domain-containing protein n=1 Tax=Alkalicoccus daliensis TaxID=745820 RepID=A0A1H0JQC0_9BACI|nr:PDZ domain-containing protein [Alkalicoccus daliensis]SDO46015.1 hypothetical protein SAMN04488053_11455 [Alkalicoccus daliensis]
MGDILIEILLGIGRLFLHPLTYIFVAALLWFHISRVKRERKDFHTRVHDVVSTILTPIPKGLIVGVIVSAAVILIGIELPYAIIPLITLIWLVQMPFRQMRWYSLTVTLSVILLLLPFLPAGGTGVAFVDGWLSDLNEVNLLSLGTLLVLLLIAESVLVLLDGAAQSSPALRKSPRGKIVGEHIVSRAWILPVALLFPAGSLSSIDWWPLMGWNSETFGLMLLPFMLGFQTKVQSYYPEEAASMLGRRMMLLAVASAGLLAASFYFSGVIYFVAAFVLIGREWICVAFDIGDKRRTRLFTARENGLTVVDILPKSTAEKMDIRTGETIVKVNGRKVETQREFYDGLQQNSAFAKLEVIDHAGEKRFAQASVYENDHYLIGCLFVPDDEGVNLSLKGLRSSVVVHEDRRNVRDLEQKALAGKKEPVPQLEAPEERKEIKEEAESLK